MWRANACRRVIFPVPVFLNRLDAPLWVLSFGIKVVFVLFPAEIAALKKAATTIRIAHEAAPEGGSV